MSEVLATPTMKGNGLKQNEHYTKGESSRQLKEHLRNGTYPVKIKVRYPKTDNADCQKRMDEISTQSKHDMTETLITDHEIKLVADKESLERLLTERRKQRREKPYEEKQKKRASTKRTDILSSDKSLLAQLQAERVDLKMKIIFSTSN